MAAVVVAAATTQQTVCVRVLVITADCAEQKMITRDRRRQLPADSVAVAAAVSNGRFGSAYVAESSGCGDVDAAEGGRPAGRSTS